MHTVKHTLREEPYIDGTQILNASVGPTRFCEAQFTEKKRSPEPVDEVAALENTQVTFTFRKLCLGVLRVLPL